MLSLLRAPFGPLRTRLDSPPEPSETPVVYTVVGQMFKFRWQADRIALHKKELLQIIEKISKLQEKVDEAVKNPEKEARALQIRPQPMP